MTPEQIRADRKLSKDGPRFQFVPGTGFMGSEATAFTPSGEAWNRRVLRLVELEDAYLALTDRVAQLKKALAAIELQGGLAETYDPVVSAICRTALSREPQE